MVKMASGDNFAQYAVLQISMPAGTPLVAPAPVQLMTGLTTLQKIAWSISKIEVDIPVAILNASTFVRMNMSLRSTGMVGIDVTFANAAMLWKKRIEHSLLSAVGFEYLSLPLVDNLSEPLLVLPQMLWGAMDLTNTADLLAFNAYFRIWYRNVELKDSDFWDLVQLQQPISS